MRYEVFWGCFEAKETFLKILFPTKYSNVFYLQFSTYKVLPNLRCLSFKTGFRDSDLWPSHELWPDRNTGRPDLAGRCQSPLSVSSVRGIHQRTSSRCKWREKA